MNTVAARQTYVIAEPFDKALKFVRQALAECDLSVASEADLTDDFRRDFEKKQDPPRLLLVHSPLLLFEAIALDRSAAVLVPLHLLVTSDGYRTQVVLIDPIAIFERRLPVSAVAPLEQLRDWTATAIETAVAWAENAHRQFRGVS